MTPALRIRLLAFLTRVSEMQASEAHCYCGRLYRLMFDADMRQEIALLEGMIEAEPEPGRFTYLEWKK